MKKQLDVNNRTKVCVMCHSIPRFFPLGNGSVISFTERETVELDGILSLEYVEFEYL